MNLFEVANFYINRIATTKSKTKLNDNVQSKIVALLLDKDTTSSISMCATQSDLLNHNIYLVDTIENQHRDVVRNIKCLVYVKPSDETIEYLVKELQNPRYGEYYIYFNNTVSKTQLESLAEADDMETVCKIEEVFQDYLVVNEDLFYLNMPMSNLMSPSLIWEADTLKTCTNSIISLLLSLKLKPEIVFERNSKLCQRLAKEVALEIDKNDKNLFDFSKSDSAPLLILLDRKNDPLTPFLQPWTYQSMIKEYIGMKRNMVDLSNIPDVDEEVKKVTLSSKQDPFYKETLYLNFGELGDKVKKYVSTYKDKTQSSSQISTIEDIKLFIEKYPEFKKLSGNVAKHMTIVGELDRQLQLKNIWELSELEQNISVHDDNRDDYSALLKLLDKPSLSNFYKLKISCIFVIRHGAKAPQKVVDIVEKLKDVQLPLEDIQFLQRLNKFVNEKNNGSNDLIDGKSGSNGHSPEKDDLLTELAKRFNSRMKRNDSMRRSGNIADNVYMQHVPQISEVLSLLAKNKLSSDSIYQYYSNSQKNLSTASHSPPQDVIIFFVGGVTFEEARLVHEFNETMRNTNGNIRLLLGGTDVVSTKEYIDSMR